MRAVAPIHYPFCGVKRGCELPKKASELSAIEVKRLCHPGKGRNVLFAVGGVSGLHLQITAGGSKSWVLRATVGAKRRDIGLGGYPDVTLAHARERAREAKDQIWRGVDPIEERKASRAALTAAQKRGLTFAEAVERCLEGKLAEFRNEKHRKQWRSTLDNYALPAFGEMLVGDLTVHDMLRALEPIWAKKTETATRLRGRLETVLAWATVAGHRKGDNPARWKGNLDALLPKPGKVAKSDNFPALALTDAAAWFAALRRKEGTAARALEFLTLCASRSGEIRGAAWDEFDLNAGIWTIPAARMKAGREHRVPLSGPALALVKAMPRMAGSPYVFAAARGGQLSDMALSGVMRRMQGEAEASAVKAGQGQDRAGWRDPRSGRPAVPHGLRSTFRDWISDLTEFPRDMAEVALAHAIESRVEAAYRRSDMLERRRAMMVDWAQFLGVM